MIIGSGIIKGMAVTARNFIGSYFEKDRLTTVQYPEQRDILPERNRSFPFLIFDGEDREAGLRCVACKICENECPPKCIYIVIETDENGKSMKRPKVFDIDISVCMSCQICAEVCPFEAIKMDQVYELSRRGRFAELLMTKPDLAKSNGYYHKIHPTEAAEVDAKLAEAAAKKETEGTMIERLDQIFVWAKQLILGLLAWAPDWIVQIISSLINIAGVLGVFLTLFALISVMERKILARIQNRYGPNRVGPFGLFQPVADGIKMLIKEDIVPATADKVVHFLAPIAMVAPTILALCVIPYGRNMTAFSIDGGILFFFAVGSATELAVFMAGWASNNKYSMLGAMRAIAQMVSYELPLIVSVLPVVMVVGSLSPDAIVAAQSGYAFGIVPHWFVLTPWGAVGFVLFFIAGLVESNRTPFDLPEGESEIVAGHMTEYSGFKYATFFMAEYFGMFAVSGLAVTLFLGGWHAPMSWLQIIPSYVWFFLKLSVLLFTFIWIRGTLPRIRVDQVMNFAWKFMLPMTFACVLAAAVWHYGARGLAGWLWSLAVVVVAYAALSRLLNTQKKFATRTYRFAE